MRIMLRNGERMSAGAPPPTLADALLVNAAARVALLPVWERELIEECLGLLRAAGGPGPRAGQPRLERLAFAAADLQLVAVGGRGWDAGRRRLVDALEAVLRDRCALALERMGAEADEDRSRAGGHERGKG